MKDMANQSMPHELKVWLSDLQVAEIKSKKENQPHVISYVIVTHDYMRTLSVEPYLQKVLKRGGLGKSRRSHIESVALRKHATEKDRQILGEFHLNDGFDTSKLSKSSLLESLIETERCFLDDLLLTPVTLGPTLKGTFEWQISQSGEQRLELKTEMEEVFFYILDDLWYISEATAQLGKVDTGLPLDVVKTLFKAPSISAKHSQTAHTALQEKIPSHQSLHPKKLSIKKKKQSLNIQPVIEFNQTETCVDVPWYYDDEETRLLPTATIYMRYGKQLLNILQQTQKFRTLQGNEVHEHQRDLKKEGEFLSGVLNNFETAPLFEFEDIRAVEPNENRRWVIRELLDAEDDVQFFNFKKTAVERLKDTDWEVLFSGSAYEDILELDDSYWYSGLESSDNDFFKLQLGVEINDQKVDILPTIIKLLNEFQPQELVEQDDNETLIAKLESGDKVAMPFARIKPMMRTIMALFNFERLNPTDELQVSKAHAALMYEMQKAHESCKLRWHGSQELTKLGKKLSKLTHIKEVKPATKFKAELRSYQQDGLNWLQFLREYQLAGVLADDMGLGKTVQTLAHLCVEKQKRRLKAPCLIVAPTSLMTNWQQETEKFAPNLSYMVFHGDRRHEQAEDFNKFNLIFTTYDLITRDKDIFLNYDFYYVILDEAQRIKNAKAKSTQIILQMKSEHRLCLTGTPMENHLGELWSLFHFLMPGFLGDPKTFAQLFRTPIEKHNNAETRARLGKRLKPFLLRRLKSEVVEELPEKTEIIRHVELSGQQRDIYESIRLTMESKVQKAIANKGVSRSHIEILEALLRLRQTCCDPRLLQLDNTENSNSQKLDDLMNLLTTLVEEGRSVLLFSQFTSMIKLIEAELNQKKLDYVKLTGQTKDRKTVIEKFQNGEANLFLISLKAGGVGLNLTQADTVIHYDPWWNPAVEDQATDRSHRIGQKNAVFVYKFIAKGTVEETINQMQQKKRGLIKGLFDEKEGSKLSLSQDDLQNLFKPIDDAET